MKQPSYKAPSKLLNKIKDARDFRQKQEALWMELDYMRDGNHYVYYDSVSRGIRVVPVTQRKGVRRTVNLMRSKERGVVNLITRNEPAFNIRPDTGPNTTPQERQLAKRDADVIQFKCTQIYRDRKIKQKFKEIVKIGVNRGLAIAQVVWSDDDDDIDMIVRDPYDCLIDPGCQGDITQAQFIVNETLVNMEYLKKNKYEHLDQIKKQDSERMSGSDYRQSFLQYKYNTVGFRDHYLMQEVWEMVCNETKETDEETGEEKMGEERYLKKTCLIGGIIVREEEFKNIDRWQFVLYYPELPLKEVYPRPWFADLISLQKSIDALYSYSEEYIKTCAQGRYLLHDKTRFTTNITGEQGQQVKWTGVMKPEAMPIPPINQQMIEFHLNNTERYMSDIGGIQYMDVSKITGSNTSGRAIAQLQAQQSDSVGEPTQNLASFAENVFDLFLYFIASNYDTTRNVPHPDTSKEETYGIIGGGALTEVNNKEELRKTTTIVEPENLPKVRVEIIPGSAFSDLEAKADADILFDKKVIDRETYLDAYKMGNTREILENVQQEEEQQAVMDSKKQELNALTQQLNTMQAPQPQVPMM